MRAAYDQPRGSAIGWDGPAGLPSVERFGPEPRDATVFCGRSD